MTIYRAFKKKIIIDLDLLDENGYKNPEKIFFTKISWEPLMSIRAARSKLKISEIPSIEPPRIGGERKLQIIRWGSAYLYQVVSQIFIWPKSK